MSYILDALRKAEAERERGAVPGLHAPLPPLGAHAPAPGPWLGAVQRWWRLGAVLALVVAVVAVVGLAWHGRGRDAPQPSVSVTQARPSAVHAAAADAPASAAAPAARAAPAAVAAAAAASVAASAVVPRAAAATAAAAASKVAGQPVPGVKPGTATSRSAERALGVAKDRRATKTAKTPQTPLRSPDATPAAPPRLPRVADLPAGLRQQLPPLAVGGSVYSPQPSARMVIVNGQVFREGSQLTPELKLEQIRPKAAVLSIRGTRFELPL